MKTPFVPFDEFDQDNLFPHKSSQAVLAEIPEYKNFVKNVVGGIGVIVDDTDPANPIVNFDVTVIPPISEATNEVLGGIKLGAGLSYNPATEQVDVQFPTATPLQVFEFVNVAAFPAMGTASTIYVSKSTDKTYRWDTNVAAYKRLDEEIGGEGGASPSVFEFASLAAFPGTGAAATIYIALDSGYSYRWTGVTYVLLSESTSTEVTQTTVRNETGSTIAKGALIGYSGATSSGYPTVVPFVANGSANEINFFGLMGSTLATGNNGYCVSYGPLDNIDTRGNVASTIAVGDETWTAGEILYAHPTVAGKLTKIKPEHAISVAIIVTLHASTGRLFVSIDRGVSHLDELHDVDSSARQDKSTLQWDAGLGRYKHVISSEFSNTILITVPTDYPSINAAINYSLELNRGLGLKVTIDVENGHTESGQINIDNKDLSFITVKSLGTVTLSTVGYVLNGLGYAFISLKNNAVSPNFLGIFTLTGPESYRTAFIDAIASHVGIIGTPLIPFTLTNCGFFLVASNFSKCNVSRATINTSIGGNALSIRESSGTFDRLISNRGIHCFNGSDLLISNSTITGDSVNPGHIVYASSAGKITLISCIIKAQLYTATGGQICGNISELYQSLITQGDYIDARDCSDVNLIISKLYMKAVSPSGNLANINNCSNVSLQVGTIYNSPCTGKVFIINAGSTGRITTNILANFSGGYSHAKNTLTAAGIIFAP